jgi:hypothetical protein
MEHNDYFYAANLNRAVLGQFGIRVLTTNAEVGETFIAIQVLEDAVITSDLVVLSPINEISSIGDSSITALSLTAGTVIYGRFVNLELASGKVIAYKG